jgi:hypothetical protein
MWGSGSLAAVWAFGAPLGSGMVLLECAVHHRGSNLQHQMGSPRRPPHLLAGAHSAMQQPLTVLSVVAVEIGSPQCRAVA